MKSHVNPRAGRLAGVALILFGAVVGCGSDDPIAAARELHREGRYQEAVELLGEHITAESPSSEVLFLYGRSLRLTGQPQKAVWALREAANDPQWMVDATLELATALMRAADWQGAVDATNRILENHPDLVAALMKRGEALSNGNFDDDAALADFDRVLELEPPNFRAQVLRISSLIELERIEEAGEEIEEIEKRGKELSAGDATLGKLCTIRASFADAEGDHDTALERFGECLERYPTHPTVLESALGFFDGRGESLRSQEALLAALEAYPTNTSYRVLLAQRFRIAGDVEGSEQLLREGAEIGDAQQRSNAWAALTDHFLEIGDESAAADAYEESYALMEDPGALETLQLADVAVRAGRNERALEITEEMEDGVHRGLIEAIVYLNRGEPERALTLLDEVQQGWPDNPGARYYAARSAEQVGNFDRAIHEYRQSIRAGPGFTDAGLRLARLHEAESKRNLAWTIGMQYFSARPDDPQILTLLLRLGDYIEEPHPVQRLMQRARLQPTWPLAVALRADRVETNLGRDQAIESILEEGGLDLTHPGSAAALSALVPRLVDAERTEEAQRLIDAALENHPAFAGFHAIHGEFLEASGAPDEVVREALERAVQLDARDPKALLALGRLHARQGDLDPALEYLARANASNPHDPEPLREAADLARQAGRTEESRTHLQALLREHPYDAEAALKLSRMLLAGSPESVKALVLARSARRFGGGDDARELLVEIRGDAESDTPETTRAAQGEES